jgi:cytochrome c oxidase subunit III
MASTVTSRSKKRERGRSVNGLGNGSGAGGGGGERGRPRHPQTHRLGMAFALAGIAMLFIGLTSAYVVREGLGGDWQPIPMPRILLWNTAILLASSITLEKARRSANNSATFVWLSLTLGLGLAFLGGQLAAWRSLSAEGLFLDTNPHSSFFYVLTGVHGLHIAGGLVALAFVVLNVWGGSRSVAVAGFSTSGNYLPPARRARWIETTALYWHFMDGLWVYLLVLLFARD